MKNIFPVLTLLFTSSSFSQEKCTSGTSGQNNIITQLAHAKKNTPLTQMIYKNYNLDSARTEAEVCVDCAAASSKSPIPHIELEKTPKAPRLIFKSECLKESNKFKSNTTQVSCPDGTKSKTSNFCINESVLKYQNAVISSFVSCTAQEGFEGVDMASLFQMYSLESGFKPQFAYNGGVGIGQLTRIFIEDIHQKHRGHKFMKKIAESTNHQCDVAKLIAKKDLNNKPNISNSCSFISIGEGLERNILYSLIGFANSWEKDIEPKLRPYIKKHSDSPKISEIKNLALLNAYGPGGRAAARAAIKRLSHLQPEAFVKAMKTPLKTAEGRNLTVYTSRIEKRKKEIQNQLPEPIKSQFASTGAKACINTY